MPGKNKILQRVLFLGKQKNKIFLNEDFTLNYSFIANFIVRKYFKDMDILQGRLQDGKLLALQSKEAYQKKIIRKQWKSIRMMKLCSSVILQGTD